jgi:hypothetical protein
MQLHLIIPGLLWPSKALHNTAYDLDLPALSWLLGRGRLSWQAPLPVEHCLFNAFGIEMAGPPAAALRLLGEGRDPGTSIWLCADPVHLQIEKGRMSHAEKSPATTPEEMQQIVAEISSLFAELGEFEGTADNGSGRGYLRLREMPQMKFIPPSCSVGQARLLAESADAARWRRIGNEAQMLLHAMALNAQRELDGRPTLNSLWFWGAGVLPPRGASRYTRVYGDSPLLSGLARWSATPLENIPAQPDALLKTPAGETLLLLDALQAPARHLDALAWREALAAIDRDWLQALRRALLGGRLASLRITALGDEASLDIRLSRGDLLKFWRRPKTLIELTYQLTYPQGSA